MKWQQGWQTWSPAAGIDVEVFCVAGGSSQKTALVCGGIHGDEYEGPAAIVDWAATVSPEQVNGRVLAVPVMNPGAHHAGMRTNPEDGRNLARCFPGDANGTPTQRLAAALFTGLAAEAHYLIDLHSGGVEYLFLPMAGFYGESSPQNPSFAAARRFGLPHLWNLPPTDGVLSYEAFRRGAVAIGNEYLGAGQLSTQGRSAYAAGIANCLSAWGLVPERGRNAGDVQQELLTGDWLIANADGTFHNFVGLGQSVERGVPLAEITDWRGRMLEQFVAPRDGKVAAIRSKAGIHQGNWAVLVTEVICL